MRLRNRSVKPSRSVYWLKTDTAGHLDKIWLLMKKTGPLLLYWSLVTDLPSLVFESARQKDSLEADLPYLPLEDSLHQPFGLDFCWTIHQLNLLYHWYPREDRALTMR